MRDPKVVVLGAAGMLGHKLFQSLRSRFPGTVATVRAARHAPPLDRVDILQGDDVLTGVDAGDFDALHALLRRLEPDVIVNCVGVIKQRDEARAAIPSITLNALLPHRLADAAREWGGRVIHFSTDCVFSGERGGYSEADVADAGDLYGRTKFLGEVAGANAITLRTSIIGRELTTHKSLLDWFLSQNGKSVRGYTRVVYSGITTNEMTSVVSRLITDFPQLSGLFQVVSQPITKYDLLTIIRDTYGLDIRIDPDDHVVSDKSMLGDRFEAATGWRAPAWPAMIDVMAADPTPYTEWLTPSSKHG